MLLTRHKWTKYFAYYTMLLPGVIYYIIYKYFPMYGLIIAFKDFSILDGILASPWKDPWYGHFQEFYQSPYFWQLLENTFLLSIYKMIAGIVPHIVLAIFLFECRIIWFRNVVQTLSYMPHFLSWVIIYGILIAFLSPSSGLINSWITSSGMQPIAFMSSTEWFRSVLVGSDLWKDLGWGAIIYLASMSGINPALYEAAKVDGANKFRMIWHITLPGIRNVIIMMVILKLGHILDAGFEQIYLLYNISVYEVSDILDTWVFRTGLEQLNFSLAAAVGLFKSLIGLVLVLLSNQLAKKWGEGIW
jgi:putative aldouronate transport system permease protein